MTELDLMDIFGNNLASILNEQGISQGELAYIAGLSKGTISKYIHKQQLPNIRALINLSCVLEVDPTELLPFDELVE